MSWSYSPALVAGFSAACCSGIEPSAPSNSTPTPDQFYWPDKPTEHSRLSRFGMTCEPLTADRGAELLTWYLAASRARTSASPEKVPDSMASVAGFGEKWPASLAKFDPATCSLRTAQRSLLGDSDESLPTLPRSGLMLDGQCWELATLAPPTAGNESGYWQTPVADDAVNRTAGKWNSRGEPKLSAQVMFPTPRKSDANGPGLHGSGGLMWPTPTVCGNYNRKGASKTSGDGLATAVAQRMFPTATATAYKGWSANHNRATTDDRIDYTIEREAAQSGQAGRLNPDWVEWLMGWPIGQTALKPLATARFLEFVQQHGAYSGAPSLPPG